MARRCKPEEGAMAESSGLSHVAMSVPEGTLTDEFRTQLLEFYSRTLGWREVKPLRRPDRLTLVVGRSSYINVREQADSMVSHGYEHFGVLVRSAEEFQELWTDLANDQLDLQLEPLSTNEDGEGSFRFRHLLPMAVEVQFYTALLEGTFSR
jgi:hypothetical protein